MPDLDSLLSELTSGDDEQAEKAAIALQQYGQSAIDSLKNLLQEKDSDKRWWAVRALAEIQEGNTTELFVTALHDDEPSVRHCAALAMRNRPDPAAIPALTHLLGNKDHMLSRLAADALVAIGKDATPALLQTLENDDQPAKLAAVRALAAIADYASVSALFQLLDSDSAIMEYWADEGLKRMGIGMSFFEPG